MGMVVFERFGDLRALVMTDVYTLINLFAQHNSPGIIERYVRVFSRKGEPTFVLCLDVRTENIVS